MLSILIPIYQQDATKLVAELKKQCEALELNYVILVYDDKSTIKWRRLNAHLQHEFGVNYIELSENKGRAKIRNWLASAAPHPHLLFLDGDSGIIRKDFIKKYVIASKEPYDVIYGGREYSKNPSRSLKKRLHWKYGKTKESLPPRVRSQAPALNFQSNNFLIKAEVFDKIKFDEKVKGYGYEDLLFAEHVVNQGYSIKHIDNPTRHLGLEYTEDFLTKNKNAIENLVKLQATGLVKDTRLSLFYKKLKKYHLVSLIPWLYNRFSNKIDQTLTSDNPDVRAFQLLKLYWYHTELNK